MGRPEDALSAYLNDHDAGAEAALGMIDHLRQRSEGSAVAAFLAELREEVAADRAVLRRIMEVLGVEQQRAKQVLANLADKAGRIQLSLSAGGEAMSLLLGLDALTSGVSGKLALWQALESLAEIDPRLAGFDFADLSRRARAQLDGLEQQRRETAPAALAGGG